ncbi:MAG: methyltransferase [Spirochaetia bacterium]|nr:methyltransferase [Spirochaetota bacterium]MCX8096573.1 methyltransferase [Spirochaetota bacterium]MDW8112873.1 methyltransferase [Spirochaetia bacterium]
MNTQYKEVVAEIKEILKEGLCVGITQEGEEVFTRYAIPNEKVKLKIVKPNLRYGEIVEILQPSPIRQEAYCKFFGECGGCDLQMLPYNEQLNYKRKLLIEEFSRLPNFDESFIEPVIPSPSEFHYRNSVMFRVNPKKRKIGFLKRDTNIVIDIDECKIASEGINYALKKVKEQENFPQHVFRVRSNLAGDVVVNQIQTDHFEDRSISEEINVDGITYTFRISRESFFQVNSYVIPLWLKVIREVILNSKYDKSKCLDLYCGVGLISLFVSNIFGEVLGVEISKTSVDDAMFNIQTNGVRNVKVIQSDVGKILPSLDIPEIVIVNPSRVGIEENVVRFINQNCLLRSNPKMVIYSSCNYETQVRDVKILYEAGYRITKVIPFDMFPQTHHIEVVAILENT